MWSATDALDPGEQHSYARRVRGFAGYIGEFEYVDDHRSGKIVVELNGRYAPFADLLKLSQLDINAELVQHMASLVANGIRREVCDVQTQQMWCNLAKI